MQYTQKDYEQMESEFEVGSHYYTNIPLLTIKTIEDYIVNHIPTGDFLYAVLTNNLTEAVGRADDANLKALKYIIGLLYNNAPAAAWGSEAKVKHWLEARRLIEEPQGWHDEQCDIAASQGWGLFEIDWIISIQRIDETGIFDSDEAAIDFVKQQADAGDKTAILALKHHGINTRPWG